MDLFEFVTGMISVILALAAAQLFLGLAPLVQTRATVRLSVIHAAWVAVLFLITFLHWWSLWDFRDLSWTFPMFGFSLVGPGLLFFAATLINPRETLKDSIDLHSHFHSIRQPFLWVFLTMLIFLTLDGPMFGTEPVFNRLRATQVVIMALVLVGIRFESHRIQVMVSLLTLAASVLAVTARLLPGVVS